MADLLTFGEAVQRAGVSRQRLNRAIHTGRLPAERGGGPGKPTRIRFEDLQAWCKSEGLPMPIGATERSARSSISRRPQEAIAPTVQPDTAALMARLERTVEQVIGRAIDRVVDQVVERLAERLERMERSARSEVEPGLPRQVHTPAIPTRAHVDKAEVRKRIQEMKATGLSLQAIANRLNTEGVPTLSGKGRWQKGTIGNLLAQAGEDRC
jgi:excisionase family DNA binding protein